MLYEAFSRQQSNNNIENNLNINRFQTLASSTFTNSINNHPPSLTSLNNNILNPPRLNQRDFLNYYNNMKSANSNLINNTNNNILINPEFCTTKTLLTPPPPINNYSFPPLNKLTNQPPFPSFSMLFFVFTK